MFSTHGRLLSFVCFRPVTWLAENLEITKFLPPILKNISQANRCRLGKYSRTISLYSLYNHRFQNI